MLRSPTRMQVVCQQSINPRRGSSDSAILLEAPRFGPHRACARSMPDETPNGGSLTNFVENSPSDWVRRDQRECHRAKALEVIPFGARRRRVANLDLHEFARDLR